VTCGRLTFISPSVACCGADCFPMRRPILLEKSQSCSWRFLSSAQCGRRSCSWLSFHQRFHAVCVIGWSSPLFPFYNTTVSLLFAVKNVRSPRHPCIITRVSCTCAPSINYLPHFSTLPPVVNLRSAPHSNVSYRLHQWPDSCHLCLSCWSVSWYPLLIDIVKGIQFQINPLLF